MEEAIRGLFAYRPIFLYMYGYGATHEREHQFDDGVNHEAWR